YWVASGRRIKRGAESAWQAAWHNIIHDVFGELGGLAGTFKRAAGGCDWNAGSQPWTPGDRKTDWILYQYSGITSGCLGIAGSRRVARPGEGSGDRSAGTSGHSV